MAKTLNVAFVLSQIDNTGPFIVAKDIVDILLEDGHSVSIFYLYGEIRYNFPVEPIKISYWQTVDFSKFDIVHSHGFRADVYTHFHRKSIHSSTKTKLLSTVHQYNNEQTYLDYSPRVKAQLIEFVWKLSLKSKDAIATLTKDMAEHYNDYLNRTDCFHVHNGRDAYLTHSVDQEFAQKIKRAKDSGLKVLGSAGHLVPRKAFELLINLAKMRKDIFVVILGKGPEELRLKTLAKDLGVEDRVLFCGFQPNPCDYFSNLDLFVLCSLAEGFSLVIAESAAVRTPSICSDFPFIRELYTADEVPTFSIGNVQSMNAAVDKIFQDHQGFSSRVFKRYESCYTKRVMATNYIEHYRSLVSRPDRSN